MPVSVRASLLAWLVWLTWLCLVFAAILHHEPWFDEAQAWLIARDAPLSTIWLKLLHYEGTPGLWHSLLHLLTWAGAPYMSLNIVSGLIASAGAWLLIRNAPIPAIWRYSLPFTYFLCYQYAVVARSYVLLAPLLFGTALLYTRRLEWPWTFATLLSLIAATSAHGTLVSVVLFLTGKMQARRVRPVALPDLVYFLVCVVCVLVSWPAADHEQFRFLNYSLPHMAAVTAVMLREATTGSYLVSAAALALSLPYLHRGRMLGMFLLSVVVLGAFGAIVYSNVWHQGVVFLVWITALWIAGYRAKFDPAVTTALALVVGTQLVWTAASIRYDWNHNYSASRQAAARLQELGVGNKSSVYALGAMSIGIEPYFPSNIFENYRFNRGAYWSWSRHNAMNSGVLHLLEYQPDYVVVAIKGDPREVGWRIALSSAGYRLDSHIAGAIFWKTHPLEPEAFDIYRRPVAGSQQPSLNASSHR